MFNLNNEYSEQVKIVLVNPSHPGNIGAVARAIKNMGFKSLYLVSPRQFPSPEANARASGAEDILDSAVVTQTLEQALEDCDLVLGLSSRLREIPWPTLDAREAGRLVARQLHNGGGEEGRRAASVAIVFGQEQSGLLNEELAKCHYQVMINANPEYASLNLAQAVQIVTYECRLAMFENSNDTTQGFTTEENKNENENNVDLATAAEMELYYKTLEQMLIQVEFLDPKVPRHLMLRLRRLFGRARPDKTELNILLGMCRAVQKNTAQTIKIWDQKKC